MLSWITLIPGVLRAIPNWISVSLLASLALYTLHLVKDYRDLGAEVEALKARNQGYVNEITAATANVKSLEGSLAAMDERYNRRLGDLDQFCRILKEVEDSKDPADKVTVGGAVGKVLERLDAIDAKKLKRK